jgi:hypothetical protein
MTIPSWRELDAVRVRLTVVGACCNPACARPLFAELGETEACADCDPPREGLPTTFKLMGYTRPPDASGLCSEGCCQ